MKNSRRISGLVLASLIMCFFSAMDAQEITKKNGKVKYYFADGKRTATGRVHNYRKNGPWKFRDEEGHIHHISTYLNDTLNGQYTEYDTDGSVTVFGNYSHGLKDGTWRMYFATGEPLAENNYLNGHLEGRQVTWYQNGDVSEVMYCSNDRLLSRKSWYPGGRLRLVETYKDGESNGRWISYPDPLVSNDTATTTADDYSDGVLYGWHGVFAGGMQTDEMHYQYGQADGESTQWDEHGHLVAREHFIGGKLDGLCTYYNCEGMLRSINYQAGERNGPQTDYDRSGNPLNETWFNNGVRDSMKTFYVNGAMATRRIFTRTADNMERCEYSEWDEEGHLLLSGCSIGDVRCGEWYTYYISGAKKSRTTYSNGAINGPYTRWYENGTRMVEFTVLADGVNSNIHVWTAQGRPMKPGSDKFKEIVDSAAPAETYADPVARRAIINKQMEETTSYR